MDKTAIHNKNPSPAIVWLYENGYFPKEKTILDYGAGYGRNTNYLRSKGCKVWAFDPYHYVIRKKENHTFWLSGVANCFPLIGADIAFSSYVLNVVDEKQESMVLRTMKMLSITQLHIVRNRDLWKLKQVEKQSNASKILSLYEGVKTTKGLQRLVYLKPSDFETIRDVSGYKIYKGRE